MSKQTATNWLMVQLYEKGLLTGNANDMDELLEQAELMQKKDSVDFGLFISNHKLDFQPAAKGRFIGLDMKYYTSEELYDQYYNKTYGSKGSDGHELDDDIPPTSQYFPTSSQTQHNSPKVENKTSFGEVSDDEIEKQADIIDSGMHRMFFITGARWYREQLKEK